MQQPQAPMQPIPPLPRPGSRMAALQYGLIFGGGICIIDIIYALLIDKGAITWFYGINGVLYRLPAFLANILSEIISQIPISILLFVGFVLAGLFAARKSKRASSGALAGLLAGGSFLIIDVLIVNVLLTVLIIFPQMAQAQATGTDSSILVFAVISSLVNDLVLLGVGALLGWLGGVMGGGKGAPDQHYPQQYMFVPAPVYTPQVLIPVNPNPMYGQPMQPGQPKPDSPFSN